MDDDFVLISAVEHHAYCPRQASLIHVEGIWAENTHTVLGSIEHAAVDRAARLVKRQGVDCWLSLPVISVELGVRGVCDAVEMSPTPVPVEHKPIRSKRHLAPAAQQLAIQAVCLEELFSTEVPAGVVFAGRERRRQEIPIDSVLRAAALSTLEDFRTMRDEGVLPARVCDSRCRACSLRILCLVDDEGRPMAVEGVDVFAASAEGDW